MKEIPALDATCLRYGRTKVVGYRVKRAKKIIQRCHSKELDEIANVLNKAMKQKVRKALMETVK